MSEKNGKRVAFHNLGCKVNGYEAEIMLQSFREKGYEIVTFEQKADIYVVNTCTVTRIADKKSRQMLHRARRLNPDAVVVAAGCFVETGSAALAGDTPVDLAVGNLQKARIAEIVEEYLTHGKKTETRRMPLEEITYETAGETGLTKEPFSRTRAWIKVQDGCNQFCTYCVIPYARGRARSRDAADIEAEVSRLAAQGVREIVLTGIHLSSYGAKENANTFDGRPLIRLIERLSPIDGIARIRLGSLEPRLITEEIARAFAALSDPAQGGKLCPHFHLSLQSGCDETLRRMNRHYTVKQYARSVEFLRNCIDRPAITTDIITGFPGETEEEFLATRQFLQALGLYEMHVFPYSRREGTIACSMPGQCTRAVKESRSADLLSMTASQARAYRALFIGERLKILWEDDETVDGIRYLTGHTERYVRAAVPYDAFISDGNPAGTVTEGVAERFLTDEILLIKS
ncbi:MAG: tRNA (N(6)-L-threonylcarbamoyladenosine(37)-C(2))-methylthiotransferase MtaB [Lachnospiraceae bacterium]|nr:tRNA (N(6)-L-threonylcarbamoyladenosine(37)-C(2))-methylthiotransferase MtaB [Lachnospiraceae bacterium]